MKRAITAITIICAIILITGCGQQQTNQELSDKNSDQNIDGSANQKTYSNKEYGFAFHYPGTWILDESNSTISPKSPKNCGPHIVGDSEESTCLDSISLEVVNNNEKLSISDFWQKEYGWENEQQYTNLKEQKIGDVTAFTATTIGGYDGAENYTFWVTLSDGNFFALTSSYLVDDQKKVFDDIISSFRFTK